MIDYLRLMTAITVARCERTGLPVPKHDLTDAEREAGHQALDDAERIRIEHLPDDDGSHAEYRAQDKQADERIRDAGVPPWNR